MNIIRYLPKLKRHISKHHRLISTKIKTTDDLNRIRNIGIIAHIDAGKTTTTERMLYYAGAIDYVGEVHHGDTITDYLSQERERGITITSAAVTFRWKRNQINLIDTPGHVDFTFEVERALRVLDGAVTILDASAGVEPQTVTVWNQARRYKVPSIIYLNKMDKPSADVNLCLDSIRHKLQIPPLLIQQPYGTGSNFKGIIDPISMQLISYDEKDKSGKQFLTRPLAPDSGNDIWLSALEQREKIIDVLSGLDDKLADKIIDQGTMESISAEDIRAALINATLNRKAFPILLGTSYHNKGVQQLLDAIVNYLPNPKQITHEFLPFYQGNLCGLVFKIIHDQTKGMLAFIRIYSGAIQTGSSLYNVNQNCSEKVSKLMIAFADEFTEAHSVMEGNIAVVSGLKNIRTGDTVTSSESIATQAKKLFADASQDKMIDKPVLAGIETPDPVFFCTIEPPSASDELKLEKALNMLQKEDPTFKCKNEDDSGQTIIYGMGELHIDIIKDRILKEHKVDAFLGPLQINYREFINQKATNLHVLDKLLGGEKQYVEMEVQVKPIPIEECIGFRNPPLKVLTTQDNNLGKIYPPHLQMIRNALESSYQNGPLLGFPLIGAHATLLHFRAERKTTLPMIFTAALNCFKDAYVNAGAQLLEPIMKLYLTVGSKYVGRVIQDLTKKRAHILEMKENLDNTHSFSVYAPLSELLKYSSHIRTITSGNVGYTIEFSHYSKMNTLEQNKAIEEVTGFKVG